MVVYVIKSINIMNFTAVSLDIWNLTILFLAIFSLFVFHLHTDCPHSIIMETFNETGVSDAYVSVLCPRFMNKKLLCICLGSLAFIAACMPANIVAGVHLFQVRSNDQLVSDQSQKRLNTGLREYE